MTQVELLRLGWSVMFTLGLLGALLLLVLAVKDRLDLGGRNGVLRAQANSIISDGVLILMCALFGLVATAASWLALQLVALASLVAFGLFFNVMILNMLRGRRAVTRSLRLTVDKLEKAKAEAPRRAKEAV